MRLTLLPFLFVVSTISLTAQRHPEWSRVYTLDEGIVEMNTSLVTRISADITRVRFRWTFHQPQVWSGDPRLKYKSRLEVMEFNCSKRDYRPYHLTFLNAAGNTIRIDDTRLEWRGVDFGSLTEKLLVSACNLVTRNPVKSSEAIALEKTRKFALAFTSDLNQTKDFKPVIGRFFAPNYLDGYLRDENTNWFHNLKPETAAQVSRAELERFYVALLNAGYLSSLYLISEVPSNSPEPIFHEQLLPSDVSQLIMNHPYTRAYQSKADSYDYLAENVDSVQRLRSYTNLLEQVGALMRKHVIRVRAERSKEYKELRTQGDFYQPKVWSCRSDCLGFPKGTKLYEVKVPVFHLQVAEIEGRLKIVSATNSF